MSWHSPSLYGAQGDFSESRFGAVQFYGDPTNDCEIGSGTS